MSTADDVPAKMAVDEAAAQGQEAVPESLLVQAAAVPPEGSGAPGVPNLRKAALSSAMWISVGYGALYALRWANGVVQTHLVPPEVFWLLGIAMLFIQGLHMFSDVGIGMSIIRSKREDPDFLNTAWTLQVIRGLVLWGAMWAIAWPVAVFWQEPQLLILIPLVGATAAIDGFNSTALFTLGRRLARGRLVALEVGVQTTGMVVTTTWLLCLEAPVWEAGPGVAGPYAPWPPLWLTPVWGFVVGSLVTSLLNMTLTHLALSGGVRSRFRWERAAVHELLHFGKWVFFGTVITFLAFQADRLIMSKVAGATLFGVFDRAMSLAGIATGLMSMFATQLVFPVYSRMHQEGRDIRGSFRRVHGSATAFAGLLVVGMIASGPAAVRCMYGDAYHDAAWMLPFVTVGAWFQMLEGTTGASLLTLGQARAVMAGNASRLVGAVVFVPAGYWLGQYIDFGVPLEGWFVGMLLGFVAADFVRYLVVAWMARQNGMSALSTDLSLSLAILVLSPAAAFGGEYLAALVPVAHPKVQALILFLCQGSLALLLWGLLYRLWFRKHLRQPAPELQK